MGKLSAFKPFFTCSKMDSVMTIATQSLKILNRIVLTVSINMVNTKKFDIVCSANVAPYFSIFFNAISETIGHILQLGSHRSVDKIRAFSRAKFFLSALMVNSSFNQLSTQLTRPPFDTGNRTIFFAFPIQSRNKFDPTTFTGTFIIFRKIPHASARTKNLFISSCSVFKSKFFTTMLTIFHEKPLIKGTLCH